MFLSIFKKNQCDNQKINTREKIKMVQNIAKLAIDINDKSNHHVFFYYSGHVDWIDVSVYFNGWNENSITPDFQTIIRFSENVYSPKEQRQLYVETIDFLKKIK